MDPLQGLTMMNPIVAGLRRKGKYGPPTFWLRVGSKKNSATAQIFRLARKRLLSQISPRAGHRRLHDTGASHSDGWFRLCIPGGHSDGSLLKEDRSEENYGRERCFRPFYFRFRRTWLSARRASAAPRAPNRRRKAAPPRGVSRRAPRPATPTHAHGTSRAW